MHSFLKPIIVIFIGGLIGLLIAETTLRIIGKSWPIYDAYLHDENVGNVLKPNVEFKWTKEGEAHIKINSRGLRDSEHQIPKPENTWRFAVLGDSMAEALQVEIENTFWSEIERTLSECSALQNKKIEAINFGVSGHGTAQELITLRTRVWEYEPDLVLLAITNGNDIRNNSPNLEPELLRPFFLRVDNDLVLDESFKEIVREKRDLDERPAWQRGIIFSLNKLHVGQLVFKAARQIKENLNRKDSNESENWDNWEPGLDYKVFAPPINQDWEDAWWVTEQLVSTINKEVLKKEVLFHSFMIPTAVQVNFDKDKRAEVANSLGANNLSYPENRMNLFTKTNNIPFQSLLEEFLIYAEKNKEYLHGFENAVLGSGHLNEKGHYLAGEIVARKICERLDT